MLGVDTGIDNVGAGAGTSSIVVGVGGAGAVGARVGDTGQAPRSVGLSGGDLHDRVLLDVQDVGVVSEVVKLIILEGGSEAVEVSAVGVVGVGLDGADGRGDGEARGLLLGNQLHDVLAGDGVGTTREDEGSGRVTLSDGRGGGHGQRHEGEESRGTHLGGCCRVGSKD